MRRERNPFIGNTQQQNLGAWGSLPTYIPPGFGQGTFAPMLVAAGPRGQPLESPVSTQSAPIQNDGETLLRFPRTNVITIPSAAAVAGTTILPQPPGVRVLLGIRSLTTSLGSLLVSFGAAAVDANTFVSLPPGGIILFDFTVPQDDVFVNELGGAAAGVIFYANR